MSNWDFYSLTLCLVITVVTLLSSCQCAPTSDPWWFQPCESDLKIRHSRSTSENLDSVKFQMNIFINHLKRSKNNINKLYNIDKTHQPKTKRLTIEWLKVKRLVQAIRRSKNKLEEFYRALQYFAGTLEILRNVNIKTNAVNFKQETRRNIYQTITYDMRLLLCEIQDNFKANNKRIPPAIRLEKLNIPPSIMKPLQYSEGHLLDVTFFSKTTSFFRRTQKVLKAKVKKTSSASKVPKRKRT